MSLGVYIYDPATTSMLARDAVPYSLSLTATLGERATFNVRIVSTAGTYRPEQGHPIELWDGATKLWGGTVDEVAEVSITEAGAATGAFYEIRGITWEQRLDRRRCYDVTTDTPAVYDRNFVFTADAGTDTITTVGNHGRSNGDRVKVKAHAQGALCGGLDPEIEYYVINATATTLQLSLTSGGSAVDITSTGTLDQVLITYRAGEIVKDLLTTYASFEGIGQTNIDDGAVVDTIEFGPGVSVSEAIAQLATLSGFAWWVNYDRELYFEPRTATAAPFNISLTSGNYRSLRVRRTREDKINSALVGVDWSVLPITSETFTGDGTTRLFTLANRAGEIHSITLNGNEQTAGAWLGLDDRNWYWQYGSTAIRQDPDDAVLTSGDTLVVNYYVLGQNTAWAEDSADIIATAAQEVDGSGRYQTYYERAVGYEQARADAEATIAAKKDAVTEIEYETDQEVEALCTTLRPGQIQTIANATRGVSSADYLIREVRITDVGGLWLRFTVRAITGYSLTSTAEYWRGIAAGGGGAVGVARAGVAGGGGGTSATAAGATGQIQFNTSGALDADADLHWDDSLKRLGVGTATPQYPIHARKDQTGFTWLGVSNQAASGANAGLVCVIAANNFCTFSQNSAGDTRFSNGAAAGQNIYFATGGSDRVTITGTGNMGINTATPDARLTVNGAASFGSGSASAPSITRAGDLNTGLWFPSADHVAISTGGAERWRIDSSGDIGIGTGSPSAKLEVNGTFRATGAATLNSTLALGGSVTASASDTHDIGSSTRFRNIYGKAVNAASVEIANGTFVSTFWRQRLVSASQYNMESGSGTQAEISISVISSSDTQFGIRGTLYPLNVGGSNGDLGYSGTRWRKLFVTDIDAGGVIKGSGSGSYIDTDFNTAGQSPYRLRGSALVDNGGVWVSSGGVNVNAGVAATGYNIFGGGTGQTVTVNFSGGFTIGGTSYNNLVFTGGVLTNYT